MNERIQELEAQCWEHDQSWTGVGQRVFNRKKFAELIVQECINVCLEQRDPGNLNYKPSKRFAEALQCHFGVE